MGFVRQSTSPAQLPRADSAVAFHSQAREVVLQHMNQRRHITMGRLSAAITPDCAIFDDTHSRTYFSLHSASEGVIYHSQAEYVEAQARRAAPHMSSPVTVNTHCQTYENLRSYTISPSGERIYHSQAEWVEAQSACSRVSSTVTVNTHGQTYDNLATKADRSYTTSLIGDKTYHTDARGVSSPITLDSCYGQTYDNITPLEIPSWSSHESGRKLYTFNDHKIMFEIFEEEKEKWSLHGQTFSNLPTSSSDLPSWSIRESERKPYNFDTHQGRLNDELDSGYEADTEDNTHTEPLPEWYFPELSRKNRFDLQIHTQLSQIFEAKKEFLKASERLRAIEEKIRVILAQRNADHTPSEEQQQLSEETEFEEDPADFYEQLQRYQPSTPSSYSPPHDSDFSAASEMLSMTSGSDTVGTESEKSEERESSEGSD